MAYLEGRLRGIGGEGERIVYLLELEVDLSGIEDAGELEGEQVALTGDVEIVDHPERGKVMVFKATSAAGIEEE